MKLLRSIPLFPFLLVLVFCLHGSVENYGYIDPGEVLTVGLFILFCVMVLILAVYFVSKNYAFASLIVFFVSLWYLFFGALHDWIKSISFLSFLQSYSVIVPVLLVTTVAWIIIVKKKRSWYPGLIFYLNILLLIYCSIDTFTIVQKYFNQSKKPVPAVAFDFSKVKSKHNVYYLLFDEYPGYKSLQDSFGFRNDSLYNFLQGNGFKILPTFANYNLTLFSMSSIFNMQYVDTAYNHTVITQQDIQQRTSEIRYGQIFSLFKMMGYHIENYSIFDIGKLKSISAKTSLFPVHDRLLTDKLFHNRVIRDIGWWFVSGKFKIPFIMREYIYKTDNNNKKSEQMLEESLAQKNNTPKFSYTHFLMPHAPYSRDSTGELRNYLDYEIMLNPVNKKAFLSNLKYTNTVIQSLVNKIVKQDSSAIVVVMSDHGYLHSETNSSKDNPLKFDNICAVRLPGNNFIPYKNSWSNVNFFRYLFNCEFGQQIPYVKDSSIWVNY